jgi:hypothetical protein
LDRALATRGTSDTMEPRQLEVPGRKGLEIDFGKLIKDVIA